jgi:hypothetical protein
MADIWPTLACTSQVTALARFNENGKKAMIAPARSSQTVSTVSTIHGPKAPCITAEGVSRASAYPVKEVPRGSCQRGRDTQKLGFSSI